MSTGLFISRPNEDAFTTDNKKLSYSSDLLSPKIFKQGPITWAFNTNDTDITVNIDHGLGIIPSFDVYSEIRNSNELWQHEGRPDFFADVGIARQILVDSAVSVLKARMIRSASLPAANHRGYYFIYMDLPLDGVGKLYKSEKTGLWISPSGVNAEIAGDSQLSYHSGYSTLEVFRVFDFSLALSATVNEVRINHGLGYWPAFNAGVLVPFGSSVRHAIIPITSYTSAVVYGFCTNQEIIIRGQLASGSSTVQGKVVVFYNQIA